MALNSILTIPAITKGASNEVQVDKSALALDAKVSGDAYFSDTANWKTILINYQTPTGKQTQVLSCDASLATPVGNFNPSLTARDDWEVQSFVIIDHDGGKLEYNRSEMTVGDFDIALGSALTVFETITVGQAANDADVYNGGLGDVLQTVLTGVGYNLNSIDMLLNWIGGSAVSGNFRIRIFPVTIDALDVHISGAHIAESDAFDTSALTNTSTAHTITFPSNVALNDTSNYAFMFFNESIVYNGSTIVSKASGLDDYPAGYAAIAFGVTDGSATTYCHIGFAGLDAYIKFN